MHINEFNENHILYLIVVSPNRGASDTLLDADICDDTSGDFRKLLRCAANVSC